MIHTLHNEDDFIYAYVNFITVDIYGKAQNEGLYIYVSDMWIHDNYRRSEVIKELIDYIDSYEECKNAKFVYWRREKYNRISKPYSRERFKKEMCYGR